MDTIIFLAFAAAYLIVLAWAISLPVRRGRLIAADAAILVVAALIYDNTIIGLGVFLGEGAVLEALNAARYWLHALITPLLVVVAWNIIARTGMRWTRTAWAAAIAGSLTVALIAYELVVGVVGMNLVAREEFGALSYANENAPDGAPLMVLVVSAVLLAAGIIAWVRMRWPWLALGTALMVAGSSIPLEIPSSAATNAFELVLLISIVATVWRLGSDRAEQPARAVRATR